VVSTSGVLYMVNNSLGMGRDSSVGMATRYGLDGPGIESRWGTRFSAPIHTPRRCPYFDVVVGLVWSHDPESYAGGSVCYL